MIRFITLSVLGFAFVIASGCAERFDLSPAEKAYLVDAGRAEAVLDQLHDAASKADFERYFACFAPNAVFLGTDASERWTVEQFKDYARPIFAKGKGWTYTPTKRRVHVFEGGWVVFDELPVNAKYGTCRGSGSLRKVGGEWKIVQYDLSVPIPNDLLEDFAARIRENEKAHPAGRGGGG